VGLGPSEQVKLFLYSGISQELQHAVRAARADTLAAAVTAALEEGSFQRQFYTSGGGAGGSGGGFSGGPGDTGGDY
jgi:hypothetical protein